MLVISGILHFIDFPKLLSDGNKVSFYVFFFFLLHFFFVSHLSSYTRESGRYNFSDYGESFPKDPITVTTRGLCGFQFRFERKPRIVLCSTGFTFTKIACVRFKTNIL